MLKVVVIPIGVSLGLLLVGLHVLPDASCHKQSW
jgi:hypothetical protein